MQYFVDGIVVGVAVNAFVLAVLVLQRPRRRL